MLTRSLAKLTTGALAAGAIVGAFPSIGAAAPAGADDPTEVSENCVPELYVIPRSRDARPGGPVGVNGTICLAEAEVVLSIDGVDWYQTWSDDQGSIAVTMVGLPSHLALGAHAIEARSGDVSVSTTIVLDPGIDVLVSPPEARPGVAFDVTAQACDPDVTYRVTFEGSELATGVADENGMFVARVTVPSSATPGPATISVTCGSYGTTADFIVLAPTTTMTPPVAPPVVNPRFAG